MQAVANERVGANHEKFFHAMSKNLGRKVEDSYQLYGVGGAPQQIVNKLAKAN